MAKSSAHYQKLKENKERRDNAPRLNNDQIYRLVADNSMLSREDVKKVFYTYSQIIYGLMGSNEIPEDLIISIPYVGEIYQANFKGKKEGQKHVGIDYMAMIGKSFKRNDPDYNRQVARELKQWYIDHPNEEVPLLPPKVFTKQYPDWQVPMVRINTDITKTRKRATMLDWCKKHKWKKIDTYEALGRGGLMTKEEHEEYCELKMQQKASDIIPNLISLEEWEANNCGETE